MQRPVNRCVQGPVSGLFQHRAVGETTGGNGVAARFGVIGQRVPQPTSKMSGKIFSAGPRKDEVQVWAMVLSHGFENIDVVCLVASVSAIPLAFAPTVASMALSWMFPTRIPSLTDSLIGYARLFCTNPVAQRNRPFVFFDDGHRLPSDKRQPICKLIEIGQRG